MSSSQIQTTFIQVQGPKYNLREQTELNAIACKINVWIEIMMQQKKTYIIIIIVIVFINRHRINFKGIFYSFITICMHSLIVTPSSY